MSTLGPLSGCERTKSGHRETVVDDPNRKWSVHRSSRAITYSITSPARASSVGGMLTPIDVAVLRLIAIA